MVSGSVLRPETAGLEMDGHQSAAEFGIMYVESGRMVTVPTFLTKYM